MKAFVGLAVVTAGLIVAIPVANAKTLDTGKSPHHAASHSNRPHKFGVALQTMFRHLLRPQAPIRHVARHSIPLGSPHKPTEVAAGPIEPAAVSQAKMADAASGPPSESTGIVGDANPPTPQILPTQDMPAVQGLELE
ncbi:hypothetical protein [Bradyrhizobium sp. Ec3.3]|uniref:hypothetical protein n=1 Tax=Bradyrhizobium sp. Ec3.3 TaxID=189753 RepID=UPI000484C65B|nr:hypothetical protein [Bradyrhizobium sp. Ec3.3]